MPQAAPSPPPLPPTRPGSPHTHTHLMSRSCRCGISRKSATSLGSTWLSEPPHGSMRTGNTSGALLRCCSLPCSCEAAARSDTRLPWSSSRRVALALRVSGVGAGSEADGSSAGEGSGSACCLAGASLSGSAAGSLAAVLRPCACGDHSRFVCCGCRGCCDARWGGGGRGVGRLAHRRRELQRAGRRDAGHGDSSQKVVPRSLQHPADGELRGGLLPSRRSGLQSIAAASAAGGGPGTLDGGTAARLHS
jgi:hypothetical protein